MRKILITVLVAAFFIAATSFIAALCEGAILPLWIDWESGSLSTGGDGPGTLTLEGRSLRAESGGDTLWSSGDELRVQSFLWCDINRDGDEELLLLCWRRGLYGESRPFWVEENDRSWSQHIFIYSWTGETMRPLWMASDIGREVESWTFDETRRLVLTHRDGERTSWDWVSWGLSNIPLQGELSFAALGDNLIHRQIYDYAFRRRGGDFSWLYEPLADELEQYDLAAIQQEGLYVEEPEDYSSYPLFGTPIEVGEALAGAGFDIVSCAGNHSLDFGTEAIDRTYDFFSERGILCPGIQPSGDTGYVPWETVEVNGIRCALLGFTESTNGHRLPEEAPWVLHTLDDVEQVRLAVTGAREEADLVVVFVHWGTEYSAQPDQAQVRWAKDFADWGADVVIGTHPHVLQPCEWVRGDSGREALVYYSLGNFVSAQTDEACREGGLAWFKAAMDGDECRITDFGMKTVETREEDGRYFVEIADS